MNVQDMNLDLAREKLAETQAFILEGLENNTVPLLGDAEINVAWREGAPEHYSLLRYYLQKFTWPKNLTEQSYVVDPIVMGEKYDGTWRQAFIRRIKRQASRTSGRSGDEWLIVLTLRQFWATDLNEDEARLQGAKTDPSVESLELIRMFPNIDPDRSDELIEARRSVKTISNPKAYGEIYEGTFAISEVGSRVEADGSVTILEQLKLIQSPADATELAAIEHLIIQDNKVLKDLGFEPGEGENLAFVWTGLNPSNRTTQITIADATLAATFANVATNYPASGWSYLTRKWENLKDGTARYTILFNQRIWAAWGHDSYIDDYTLFGNPGTANARESVTKVWENIRIADIHTIETDTRTGTNVIPAWVTSTAYIVGDWVTSSSKFYVCATAHTAGTFSTDLTNGLWYQVEIRAVTIRSNNDGSVNVSMTVYEIVNGISTGTRLGLNSHQLQKGTKTITTVRYEHFGGTETLPGGTNPTTGNDFVSNIEHQPDPDGWRSRTNVSETVTWANTDGTNLDTRYKATINNPSGNNEAEAYYGPGVPVDDAVTIVANEAADADGGTGDTAFSWLIEAKNFTERGDGEAVVLLNQQKAYKATTATSAYVTGSGAGVGRSQQFIRRVWWRRTEAARNTLTRGGAAVADFNYNVANGAWTGGVDYTHSGYDVIDHHDGAWTVVQTGVVPSTSGGQIQVPSASEVLISAKWSSVRVSAKLNDYKARIIHVYAKSYSVVGDAWTYANYVQPDTEAISKTWDEKGIYRNHGFVQYKGGSTWVGHRVQFRTVFDSDSTQNDP